METNEEMNVKIQDSGKAGQTNTKGTSRNLAEYLEHEDAERRAEGKEVFPFTKADGTPIPKEEVISKIDRNRARLSKLDDKFYHIVVSPSENEVAAMGNNEKEIYREGLKLIRAISDSYAEGFHKQGVESGDNLEIFWKPHFTRGDNDELQFHLHAIVSRRAKGNGPKLSPMTNHRNTLHGPVLGGFDRKAFAERCEKLFDELMHYDRKVAETFEFNNAMAHGTAEEKAMQADRLVREEEAKLKEELEAAFKKRRDRKKAQTQVEEARLTDAMKLAALSSNVMKACTISNDKLSLSLNLASLGITLKPRMADNGGVEDFTVSSKGHRVIASEILSPSEMQTLFEHWQRLSGQEAAFKIRQRQEQQETQQKLKLTLEHERGLANQRGIRMRR